MKTFTLPNSLLKSLCFTLLLTGFSLVGFAQMKIGDNPTTIHKSSILELESKNQALLLPRLSDFTPITQIINDKGYSGAVINGMLVYYTGTEKEGPGLYCYQQKGTTGTYDWVKIASASDAANNWSLKGNDITNGDFLGTTNDEDLVIKTGNTSRMTIAGDGSSLTIDNNMIKSGATTDLNVLVIKDDGTGTGTATILQRTMPASAFESAITGITGDGSSTKLDGGDITLTANPSETNQKFEVITDGSSNKAIINAPILGGTSTAAYGFIKKEDWDKINGLDIEIGSLIMTAAAGDDQVKGAKIIANADGSYTLQIVAAGVSQNGIVTTGPQEFKGEKTFQDKVRAVGQLAVDGIASLNGGAIVGVPGTGGTPANLEVTGTTTLDGSIVASGLNSSTSQEVLVKDATGNIGTRTLNASAYKSLEFKNDGTDLTVDETSNPDKILLNVPDANPGVRGVVSTGDQKFDGNKTFNNNVSVTGTFGVTGAATLDGATTINNTLDVQGDATLEQTVTLSGVPAPATADATTNTFNVLTRNSGTGAIEQTTISADAGKSIELGNTPVADPINGTDASNNPIKGLHIDKTTDPTKITLQVPDADADVRGVVNTTNQTIGGKKTFADNTTIGTPTTSANLTVNGGIAARTIEINAGETLSGDHAMARTILIDADAGTGNVTIKLPTDPEDGRIYTFRIVANTNLAHDITIDANGKQFGDSTPTEPHTSMTFWNAGSSRTIQFKDDKWYIISQ